MSVINEVAAFAIKVDEDSKNLYIYVPYSKNAYVVPFTFVCNVKKLAMFFDIDKMTMTMIVPSNDEFSAYSNINFKVAFMSFWIKEDLPVPSSIWLYDQFKYVEEIGEDFRDKYASHTLDKLINS